MAREYRTPPIRLDDVEVEKLDRLTQQYNLSKTSLIRKLITDARLKPPVIDRETGLSLSIQFRKVDINLSERLDKISENILDISLRLKEKGLEEKHVDCLDNRLLEMMNEQKQIRQSIHQVQKTLDNLLK